MPVPPRSELLAISEAVHGSVDTAELAAKGIDPQSVIDFSSNVNPFGPPPGVGPALAAASVERYPDRHARDFTAAVTNHLGLPTDRILAGNGSSELLHLVALAYLRRGERALVLGPTYGEYARVAGVMGAEVVFRTAAAEDGFRISPDVVEAALRDVGPRVMFLCNPNNPTGGLLAPEAIEAWARRFPDTLFVVDEAYVDFVAQPRTLVRAARPNMVVLRSMTKLYALAGLRLGYAVAVPEVIDVLRRVRPPWSVNAVAQSAGVAALDDRESVQQSLEQLAESKAQLISGLESSGFSPVPSATHFFLVPVENAARLRETLLTSGLLVRDCSSFGLAGFIRISPHRRENNARLLEALRGHPHESARSRGRFSR